MIFLTGLALFPLECQDFFSVKSSLKLKYLAQYRKPSSYPCHHVDPLNSVSCDPQTRKIQRSLKD